MQTYESGTFTIKDQTMKIFGTTINLANVDNIEIVNFKRHSLIAGLKEWVIGLIIMMVIYAFNKNLGWLAGMYILTIIILVIYNYKEWQKIYYGLKIETNRTSICLKSTNISFIYELRDTIEEAINQKKSNYTINIGDSIINNGIINKGNNNKNEVKK